MTEIEGLKHGHPIEQPGANNIGILEQEVSKRILALSSPACLWSVRIRVTENGLPTSVQEVVRGIAGLKQSRCPLLRFLGRYVTSFTIKRITTLACMATLASSDSSVLPFRACNHDSTKTRKKIPAWKPETECLGVSMRLINHTTRAVRVSANHFLLL